MTHKLIAILIALCLFEFVIAQPSGSSLDIIGESLISNGPGILLFKMRQLPKNEFVPIDSLQADANGAFKFHFDNIAPGYYQLGFKCKNSSASTPFLLIDSGHWQLNVKFDTSSFSAEGERVIFIQSWIKGLPDNELLESYFNIRSDYYMNRLAPLEDRIRKTSSIADAEILDSLNNELHKHRTEMNVALKTFILNKMNTSIAIYQTMSTWDNSDLEFMQTILSRFRKYRSNSFIIPFIEQKYQELIRTSLINKATPPFSLPDKDGKEWKLEQLIGKKMMLLDFWASWCGPCLQEMKAYKENYNKIKEMGIFIVSISTDKERQKWISALNESQVHWLNLIDDKSVAKKFGISELPTNFLIDPNGVILKKNVTISDLIK